MPRGRKKKVELTIDQQIEKVNFEIKELNEQIKEKKEVLKDLERQKKEETLSSLADALEKSGKTVEEVLEMLKD